MTNYETVIIYSPILSDDDVKKEVGKFSKLVTEGGASIIEERHWGLKQLAYPIQGKSNGIYYIAEYSGPTDLVHKIEVELKRNENILRWLTTKLDKYGIIYNDNRRKGLVGKGRKKSEPQNIEA